MLEFTNDEKKELKRLLHVAIIQESDRMNVQGIENALYFIKKIESSQDELLQNRSEDGQR